MLGGFVYGLLRMLGGVHKLPAALPGVVARCCHLADGAFLVCAAACSFRFAEFTQVCAATRLCKPPLRCLAMCALAAERKRSWAWGPAGHAGNSAGNIH
jgi:hypothetical protein